MCGISGFFHFDHNREADAAMVRRMWSVMTHRGPDDHGEFVSGPVALGFNRLSIIDLSSGHQPMSNPDGSAWVIFNGEIYNFQQLRQDLIARGHTFRTRSDTETIVHAWDEFGESCVEKLRGMFAFAIWDERRRVLFGARDRLGIKPFYYHVDKDTFAFASEIKALLELPHIEPEIDRSALAEYLHHRYVIAPHTILHGVNKLPPGHTIRVDQNGVRISRYWEAPYEPAAHKDEDAALEELDSLLDEVVRMHLISDVPLGAFLSGGLDSSTVVGIMAKQGVADIKTFSIGYDSPESELDYARVVAEHFHTDHHELRLTPEGFRDFLPKMVWHMDEPVGDEASIPLYYLAQFARRKVTVALSGEGSDEIFGGYGIYRTMMAYQGVNRLPMIGLAGSALSKFTEGKWKKYASMLGQPLESRYRGVSRVFSRDEISHLLPDDIEPYNGAAAAHKRCGSATTLGKMLYVDLNTWLADDLLVKADRMSMANSLELRVPFLDHKLVEFANSLPDRLKIRWNTGKYLLKRHVEPLLPRDIIHRTKKGFPVPTRTWFERELSDFARETLMASNGAVDQFLDRDFVGRVLDAHQQRDQSSPIYTLIVLDQWYRRFVRQPVAAEVPVAQSL
jgi:asparagine synthase (glutamine-hydrolysing)